MNNRLNIKKLKTFGGAAAVVLLAVTIISALRAAPLASPENQPLNQIASDVLNTYNLSGNTAIAYSPWFENGTWQGDLSAYPVSTAAVVSATANWKAKTVFADAAGANANSIGSTYWSAATGTNKRVIVTTDGGVGWTGNQPGAASKLPFRYNNYTTTPSPTAGTVLTSAQQTLFAGTTAEQQKIINFVRGDRSNEKISAAQATASLPANASGTLRERYSILGDIIHSSPQYVAGRVYVGANDGMLHGFDATNGQEVFAYVPSMVMANLKKLSALTYAHTYFVDGELASTDTRLVGGLGSGGKGFFALDITTPPTTADTESTARARVLWEVGAPNLPADPDLGYTFSRPSIRQLKGGQWVAIAGNGYDSTDGKPVLYIMDLESGAVVKAYADTTAGTVNGLSSPAVVDADADGFADYAYAGDINGNMWRFDLTGGSITSYKLFSGTDTKPIIGAPDVRAHPSGGYMVYFGTGRAFNSTDVASTATVQSIYGIRDQGAAITPALVTQTLTDTLYGTLNVRVASANTVNYATQNGWVVNLPAGERFFGNIQVRAGRVQFVTTNPTTTIYQNWLTQLDDLSGGAPMFTVFDLDKNNTLTSADNIDADSNGKLTDRVDNVAALKLGFGVTPVQLSSQPVIAYLASGVDAILVNQQGLSAVTPPTPCTINCLGGFVGGHIDVDTDSPSGGTVAAGTDGLGGNTDAHTHEYDKKHGQVYVDYFSLEPRRGMTRADTLAGSAGTNLNRVTEVKTNGGGAAPFNANKKFLVLLANADLSPGGKITIGDGAGGSTVTDVKVYQDALISKIQNGTLAASDLRTLSELQTTTLAGNNPIASGGTITGALRIGFDTGSILSGGLIPTNTGCVRDGSGTQFYNGRWRNGALTMHLIEVGVSPTDLANVVNLVTIQPDDPNTPAVERTGVVAEYVISGGRAQATSGTTSDSMPVFLYESTLFWHWNKGQDIIGQIQVELGTGTVVASTPCYGEAGWDAARAEFKQTLTASELAALDALIAKLEASGSAKDLTRAAKLKDLRSKIPSTGSGGGSGGAAVPTIVTEGVAPPPRTPGNRIDSGKRSWYEIGKF